MPYFGRRPLADDRWLNAWAFLLNALSRGITSVETERGEVFELLKSPGKRERVAGAAAGAAWVNLYEWPMQTQFAWSCFRVLPVADWVQIFSPLNFRQHFVSLHNGTMKGSDFEPSVSAMPKTLAHMQAMSAQLRALVYCGRSMSDLMRGARAHNDQDFFLAVRIDPAVVTGRFAAERIQRAVAVGEPRFMTRLATALRSPIRTEPEHARLQWALWFISSARQLDRLTEKSASELFIRRTHLYRQHGSKDAERSLWRYIQRWKKDNATKPR